MWIQSNDFDDGQAIPSENAFCAPHPEDHASFAENRNPHLAWGDLPDGTTAMALMVIDVDVPTIGDDVNQEGRVVPSDLPRTDFVHWIIANLPPEPAFIENGRYSNGVTPRGKAVGRGSPEQGQNDYTSWFVGDPDMEGTYRGYDGPCPPWNDSIIHHYEFRLFALNRIVDLPSPDFTIDDLAKAMNGHILEKATLTGTYTMNTELT